MSPISALEDPHEHSHRGRKNPNNQANLFRRSSSPKLYSHAVTFLYFICLLGEMVYIHQAIWICATSSGYTLVLQLKMEPGVEQRVPARL